MTSTESTTPQSLAAEVTSLFAMPDLVLRASAIMDSPTGTAKELVEVIELDAGLTATVLKLANSALYGHLGKVDTLSRAVTMIGHNALKNLVLATSAVRAFKDIPPGFVDMETYWDNSITCGVLAKLLAHQAKLPDGEALFIAGLLHGVGRLVFYAKRPAQYRQVLERVQNGEGNVAAAEHQVFGFDYADLGAALLGAWKLPEKLQMAVAFQLTPTAAPAHPKEVAVVHLASSLAANLAPCLKTKEEPSDFAPGPDDNAALATLGLAPAELVEIRMEALAASLEVIEIIHPGATTIF